MRKRRNPANAKLAKGKKIELKRAKVLRESEDRLNTLFEYAPDGIYLNDLKGNFIDGNKSAEELTSYKREELIGKSFLKLKLLSLDQIPKAAKLLAKNALGKPTGPDEFTLNRKDGSQVVVEIRTFPVKIKGQTLVLGIARDITERKQAEEELQKRAVIIDSTTDAVITTDLKGNIISCNKGAEMMYGYTVKEMIGTPIGILYPKQELPKLGKIIGDLLKGKKIPNVEITVKRRNKKLMPVIMGLTPIKDEKGKVIELVGISKDITERKKAEELKAVADKQRLDQLEKFAKVAVGRELKMVELKKRIKELELKLDEKS